MKDSLVFVTLLALSLALGSTIMLVSTIEELSDSQQQSALTQPTGAATRSPPIADSTEGMVVLNIRSPDPVVVDDEPDTDE